jgi:hypothetical protein
LPTGTRAGRVRRSRAANGAALLARDIEVADNRILRNARGGILIAGKGRGRA